MIPKALHILGGLAVSNFRIWLAILNFERCLSQAERLRCVCLRVDAPSLGRRKQSLSEDPSGAGALDFGSGRFN
jgi:hypothetical protein